MGLAADIGPYTGSTDLQMEDARHFNQGSPGTDTPFQRTRNFYPFPQQERLATPTTTPADPAI